MVTLERTGGQSAGAGAGEGVLAEFELPSEPGGEREAMARVQRAVAGVGLSSTRLDRLGTAVAEATMNAMEHGNEYRADRPVSIRVLRSADRLRVQVSDAGDRGDLAPRRTPDLEAKLEGREEPRGWGLFLIEKMVDEARVLGDGEGHTLELVVRLEGGTDAGE
jgi:anti-sigma regulatory factor (Ser/Thr protein kinase)